MAFLFYAYFDHRNLIKTGIYQGDASFVGPVLLILLLGPIGIFSFFWSGFKSVHRFGANGGRIHESVVFFDAGYVAIIGVLMPVCLFLAWVSQSILAGAI